MTVMKIRCGDIDLIEYDFSSFTPGECLHTADIGVQHKPYPTGDTIIVRAPARIRLSVLDMNRFSPCGGGLDLPCRSTAKPPLPAHRLKPSSTLSVFS